MTGEKVYFSDEVQVKLYYRSLLVMQEFRKEGEEVSTREFFMLVRNY